MSFDSLIGFAILFGLLVFLHELGHFIVAKWSGIHVEVFSLGFGPRLFGWRGAQTDYRVSLVPLGGYVKMLGEGPEANWVDDPRHRGGDGTASQNAGQAPPAPQGESFAAKPRSLRLLVMAAGATMNLFLAVAILMGLNMAGRREPAYLDQPPRLAGIAEDSPAERAGLRRGDIIVAVDGTPVGDWSSLRQQIFFNPGTMRTLAVVRDGERFEVPVEVVPAPEGTAHHKYRTGYIGLTDEAFDVQIWSVEPGSPAEAAGLQVGDLLVAIDGETVLTDRDVVRLISARPGLPTAIRIRRGDNILDIEATPADRDGQGRIGIAPGFIVTIKKYALWPALKESIEQNIANAGLFFQVVARLVTGRLSIRAVSGPVEIFVFSGQAFRQGWYTFFNLMAVFSLQLGILNLLPIPILDGGHIAILAIEGVIRRDLSETLKERLLQVGFVSLLLLMGLILYFDIAKVSGW